MYDIAIIGGGINGCCLARDAAGRGLSVLLVEMNDLSSGTSSRSTKLIHGGLRYLEHHEFSLVRKALIERETLYRIAPHIIEPLRFIFPHHKNMRPIWMMRLGLFVYDHLGGRSLLPASRRLDLRRDPAGRVLKDDFATAFEYSDCRVDDSRLVILNALDAAERGADIRPRTKLIKAVREKQHWSLTLRRMSGHELPPVQARILVNAAGPWVGEVIGRLGIKTGARVRPVKGSHIIVGKLYDHDRAYIFENPDNRIIFAIPYEKDFTLIGTTDIDITGDPATVQISPEETEYLCQAASEYFKKPVRPRDVVASYSGVRPLYGSEEIPASRLTRDSVLETDGEPGQAVLLSIFGGKITTARKLAERVLQKLETHLPAHTGNPWTATTPLPGGDFAIGSFDSLVMKLRTACPQMSAARAVRVTRAYGTRALDIFSRNGKALDPGEDFGGGLTQVEVDYLLTREWAETAEDILWRRSKLGLHLDERQVQHLETWLAEKAGVQNT